MTIATGMTGGPLSGPTGRQLAANRREILEILRRYGVPHIEVFGSVARGNDHDGSDVDLLVDLAPDTDPFDLVHINTSVEHAPGVSVVAVSR